MTIGPSTTNEKLADVLRSIHEDDTLYFQMTQEQREAVTEAEARIRERGDEEED